jgi:hypothetical protein
MATAAKFVQPIPICLAYLVPLDVDVTGNITAKLCEVCSEFVLIIMSPKRIFFGFLSSNFMKLCRNIHHSVWQLWGGVVEKIQNGGCCHGNQGAKNVKFTSNFTKFCSNVSCHIHI